MAKRFRGRGRARRPVYVQFVSLGCAKNLVDTEVMCGALAVAGFGLASSSESADVMVINTCSFIADARAESDREIAAALAWKRRKRGRRVVVAGCLPQRDAGAAAAAYPEVDRFIGLDDVPGIAEHLRSLTGAAWTVTPALTQPATYLYDHDTPRLQVTPAAFSYVKIAEGCDHRCTFCAIPQIRGRQRSRSVDSVELECRRLVEQGVRELNIIAQDITRYGRDLPDRPDLATLIARCDRIDGDFWIRLLYGHPRYLTDAIIDAAAAARHVVPYLDLPLQHVNDGMLGAMGRGVDGAATRALLARLRERWPGVAVRTAFIVGFPGETEAAFIELLEWVRSFRFERLGVFTYSPEPGTPAFGLEAAAVPPEEAQARRAALMEAQQAISLERNRALVGEDLTVLVETEYAPGRFVGRTAMDAPDVDNLVRLDGPADCIARGLVPVRITDAAPYELTGTATVAEA